MKFLILLCFLAGVVHCSSKDSLKAEKAETTSVPEKKDITTTTAPDNGTTTTVSPSSSKNPDTTTSSPTTTSKAPDTSTAPTTMSPPTTAKPEANFWTLVDPKTGEVCLLAKMHIVLDVAYNDTSDKVKIAHITVPGDSMSSGSCNSSDISVPQVLKLSWMNSFVQFTFEGNATSKMFSLTTLEADIAVDNKTFPNMKGEFDRVSMLNKSMVFETNVGTSYSCNPNTMLMASVDPLLSNSPSYFSLSEVHLQAFRSTKDKNFATAVYCENGYTPDLVPIFVGCALAVLVITVLVAYLYSRRKSQARGYLSM